MTFYIKPLLTLTPSIKMKGVLITKSQRLKLKMVSRSGKPHSHVTHCNASITMNN